jgi:UDP-glucose 4-epimerase
MSRVLVTGGAGFIGSTVVDQLRAAGHEPVIFDVRHSPHHARGEVDTVIGDVRKFEDLRRAVDGCDAIVHMAAAADVNDVAERPVPAEELNTRATLNVLEVARDAAVKRVVYASTIWVYSDVCCSVADEDTALLPPAHLYSATKLAGELYCRSYAELYDVEYTILRFGIPYGPRARPAAVVPIFVRKALSGEALTVAGGGQQSRRFVYVEDLAEGVVKALVPEAANRTYNLVGQDDVTVLDIASTVQSLIGDVEIEHVDGRAGDFGGVQVDGSRAERELGWRADTPFREGVRRYIAWHREQEDAPEPEPASVRVRAGLSSAAHVAGALVLSACAGVGAAGLAALNTPDDAADRAGFVALIALLMLPLALVARVDWQAGRRRAIASLVTMAVVAALAASIFPTPAYVGRLVHAHQIMVSFLAISAVIAVVLARRINRPARTRASDTAA